ncbi:hypothetical protein [Marinococcus halophilus]|uniref:hypothetical protein n=1 Tax=Marinococcus halophilus TaxID=1371 RepID=UPI0009A648A5|nr:hypothetical protein [Marinococcus halophilus]
MQLPRYHIEKIWHKGKELTFASAVLKPGKDLHGKPSYLLQITNLVQKSIVGMDLGNLDVENEHSERAALIVKYEPQLNKGNTTDLLVAGENFFR